MAGDDAGDDVGEVGVRVDAVEFRGFYERGDGRPVLATAVGTGEEPILAIEGDWPDRALNDVPTTQPSRSFWITTGFSADTGTSPTS